jgi:hypothetical protein
MSSPRRSTKIWCAKASCNTTNAHGYAHARVSIVYFLSSVALCASRPTMSFSLYHHACLGEIGALLLSVGLLVSQSRQNVLVLCLQLSKLRLDSLLRLGGTARRLLFRQSEVLFLEQIVLSEEPGLHQQAEGLASHVNERAL